MQIFRPPFRLPVLCIDDFLGEGDAQKVLQECIALKKFYTSAEVYCGSTTRQIDLKYRYNEVVYLDDVFRATPTQSVILQTIKHKIWKANDLAAEMPEKLAQMKEIFLIEAAKNKALPIGGGLWTVALHPELPVAPPYSEWTFSGDMVRMPEFCAPALGNKPNLVTIQAVIPENARGVLYKLGGNSGGLTCFIENGFLCYEYNLFIIQRTKIRAREQLPTGRVKIEIETRYVEPRPGGPLQITMRAAGKTIAEGIVPVSAPLVFTANDCLDIGTALGSPVSLDYYDKAPFRFNGTIEQVHVQYLLAK